jgi:hypothetical protein
MPMRRFDGLTLILTVRLHLETTSPISVLGPAISFLGPAGGIEFSFRHIGKLCVSDDGQTDQKRSILMHGIRNVYGSDIFYVRVGAIFFFFFD